MIDLNMKPKQQAKEWQPEEIAIAVLAMIIWTVIVIGWVTA